MRVNRVCWDDTVSHAGICWCPKGACRGNRQAGRSIASCWLWRSQPLLLPPPPPPLVLLTVQAVIIVAETIIVPLVVII